LLVCGLKLLVGGHLVVDDALQILAGRGQLLRDNCIVATDTTIAAVFSNRRLPLGLRRGGASEEDDETALVHRRGLDRNDLDVHAAEVLSVPQLQAPL